MSFSKIIGQDRAITILKNIKKYDKIAHSYIFSGPISCGKTMAALEFAKLLNCENVVDTEACNNCRSCKKINSSNHPEIKLYKRETANISIDIVRDIQKSLQLTKTEGKYKCIIIEDADNMTKEACNAFLKTLEEPPNFTVIILLTTSLTSLIKTILSRCQIIRFKRLTYDEKVRILKNKTNFSDEEIKNAISLASENLADTFAVLEAEDTAETIDHFMKVYNYFKDNTFSFDLQKELETLAKDKEKFASFLTFFLNKVELENFNISDNKNKIELLLKAKKYFERNVNPRLIWAWLYLNIKL